MLDFDLSKPFFYVKRKSLYEKTANLAYRYFLGCFFSLWLLLIISVVFWTIVELHYFTVGLALRESILELETEAKDIANKIVKLQV
jgi:hypothetical protein